MAMEIVWIIAAVGALLAGAGGYFLGRAHHDPRALRTAEARIRELETEAGVRLAETERQREELAAYRERVEAHFDRTASLFVDMAGSYKQLFQHLSSDYEQLSDGTARDRFQARISALLLEDDSGRAGAADAGAADPETAPERVPGP